MSTLSAQLLDFLRDHLRTQRINYVLPPRRLTGGAFSEVFEFELSGATATFTGRLVLRLYPAAAQPSLPLLEAAVQNGLADAGVPAPRVLLAHIDPCAIGQMFTVVPRLDGRAFLRGIRWDQFARDFPRLMVSWPKTAARVLARLHAADAAPIRKAATDAGLDEATFSTRRHLDAIEQRLAECGDHGVTDGLAWLRANEPPTPATAAIVHGDLWPGNVLMRGRAVSGIVDWDRTGIGDPALDVGFAKAGLALMPAPFPPPAPISQAVHRAGRSIASDLHRAYERLRPLDATHVAYFEALRCFLELAIVVAHRHRLARGLGSTDPCPPWDNGSDALTRHFTAITQVTLCLPPRSAHRRR